MDPAEAGADSGVGLCCPVAAPPACEPEPTGGWAASAAECATHQDSRYDGHHYSSKDTHDCPVLIYDGPGADGGDGYSCTPFDAGQPAARIGQRCHTDLECGPAHGIECAYAASEGCTAKGYCIDVRPDAGVACEVEQSWCNCAGTTTGPRRPPVCFPSDYAREPVNGKPPCGNPDGGPGGSPDGGPD